MRWKEKVLILMESDGMDPHDENEVSGETLIVNGIGS